MNKFFVMAILVLGFFMATASAQQKVQELTSSQVEVAWAQFGGGNSISNSIVVDGYNVDFPQSPATIEVIPYGLTDQGGVRVTFRSQELSRGTTVVYRFSLSNGTVVNLGGGLLLDGGVVHEELWNGLFPNLWSSGQTMFEALVIGPSGNISYVSGSSEGRACCLLSGPLERADVTPDGMLIYVTGSFSTRTYAYVNGLSVEVRLDAATPTGPFSPTTGQRIITTSTISTERIGSGRMVLTVCSDFTKVRCSSRWIYVSRPGRG